MNAALGAGADAVYLGGKFYSARSFAENFSLEAVGRATLRCHAAGVKVYVTVNTILDNSEIEAAGRFLYQLAELGVDAVIVQDLGLIRLARAMLPGLALHASTQMTVHNAAGVRYLEALGMERVVLARELASREVISIRQETNIGLEVFVHGALCFAYSGQCLFSSLVGGRSGNRGQCAQPCRLAYTLMRGRPDKTTGSSTETAWHSSEGAYRSGEGESAAHLPTEAAPAHLLSTRDLQLLHQLPQLVEAGVCALKIEGRMKRPEYVASVVRVYRQALDRLLAKGPDRYEVAPEEMEQLAGSFNRGFTTGYWVANQGWELMSYQRPSNRGSYLGRVVGVDREYGGVKIALESALSIGDGIEFWISRGGRLGLEVDRILALGREVASAGPGTTVELPGTRAAGVRPGDRVFKTRDKEMTATALATMEAGAGLRAPLIWEVAGSPGEPLRFTARGLGGRTSVTVESAMPAQVALNRPLNEAVLQKQLGRLGGTPFYLDGLENRLQGNLMLPLSELNRVRRAVLQELEQKLAPQRELPPAYRFNNDLQGYLENLPDRFTSRPGTMKKPRYSFPDVREDLQPPRTARSGLVGLAVSVADREGLSAALQSGANRVYLSGESLRGRSFFRMGDWEAALEQAKGKACEVVLGLPRIWHQDEGRSLKSKLQRLAGSGYPGGRGLLLALANLGSLQLLAEILPEADAVADYPLNIFNDSSLALLAERGIRGAVLSPELNFHQLKNLRGAGLLETEVLVHGRLALMVSAHCVIGARLGRANNESACSRPCLDCDYALRDRLGYVFPVAGDSHCRQYIFNSRELCLLEELPQLVVLGLSYLRIEAWNQDAAYVRRVTSVWRRAIDACPPAGQGELDKIELRAWRRSLEEQTSDGFTKGHFYRGVMKDGSPEGRGPEIYRKTP